MTITFDGFKNKETCLGLCCERSCQFELELTSVAPERTSDQGVSEQASCMIAAFEYRPVPVLIKCCQRKECWMEIGKSFVEFCVAFELTYIPLREKKSKNPKNKRLKCEARLK